MARGVRRLILLAVALAVAGCGADPGSPPTEAEARAFLDRVVTLAQAGDFDALCAIGAGNCESILEEAGREVPNGLPRIVGTRTLPSTETSIGGVVLELCGTLDSGDPYYSEMLVFRDLIRTGGIDGLHAIEPIYWSGMGIADDLVVGDDPIDPVADCDR
jgi:hypothetical protein